VSLDHILLSLLQERATGYDLKREFEAGAAAFWPARLSQIYPTLKRLEARGLLEARNEPSNKGPSRRTYVRTASGTRELKRWLRQGPVIGKERFAYLGQLSSMGVLRDPEVPREFLVQLRQSFAKRLGYLREVEGMILDVRTPESLDEVSFYDWAALKMGIDGLEARIESCDELVETLKRRGAARESGDKRQRKQRQ